MDYYTMKNGTIIPFNTIYIICMFSETLISSKTGDVIFALGDEIHDYKKEHIKCFYGEEDEK